MLMRDKMRKLILINRYFMKIEKMLNKKTGLSHKSFTSAHHLQTILAIAIVIVSALLFRDLTKRQQPTEIVKAAPTQTLKQRVNVTTTPSPTHMPIPKGEQKNCPNGFYFYENEDFSLCYPNSMSVDEPQLIHNANGTTTNEIYFSNEKRGIHVLPIFSFGEGPDKCIDRLETTVSGLNAVRELNRKTSSKQCGSLQEVTTIVTRKDGLIFFMYEDTKDSGSVDLNEYLTIESSLRVK